MWVSSLQINNIRSFAASGDIALSKNINILLGANNAGKSTIIMALYLLQQNRFSVEDIRIGETTAHGYIMLEDVNNPHFQQYLVQGTSSPLTLLLFADRTVNNLPQLKLNDNRGFNPVASIQPGNFIYPYLSKRKVQGYTQEVNLQREREVGDNLFNLVAKVDALANVDHPNHEEYEQVCIDTFGFPITAFSSPSGKQAGIIINRFNANIPLESMGEGVPNLLGLIVNLCLAEEKLFLIEEIENDVHPRALKKLLQLVTKKAENNQFVISTHSNIVTRYLGIVPESKIHEITIAPYTRAQRVPTSTYKEVKTPEERMAALGSLGYELIDADIWDGWLLLEESSAEQIIQELLIPSFAQKLHGRIKTVSTKGIDRTRARFEAMNSLFIFAHLTPMYTNRAWVVLDGDEGGRKVIQELKDEYANEKGTWNETNFINWQESNFERYYPARFKIEVDRVLSLPHKEKYEGKKVLLKTVLDFIEENREAAKEEFAQSAQEVIKVLQEIEEKLFPTDQY